MNIGVVTVKDFDYHPNRRLREAAGRRGHRLELVHPYRGWPGVVDGRLLFAGLSPTLDLLVPRQGAEIGESSLAFIEQAALCGVSVVNRPAALRLASDKFRTCRALCREHLPVPDSFLVNTAEAAEAASEALGGFPLVVKPAAGRQGTGVVLVSDAAACRRRLASDGGLKRGVVLQRFIPPKGRSDFRILVVGGEAVAAMAMQPKEGDFRSNFHLTGRATAAAPGADLFALACRAADAVGLQIAGVDLVRDDAGRSWIMEVNYAPGFRGLEAATGLDIAGILVEYLERFRETGF